MTKKLENPKRIRLSPEKRKEKLLKLGVTIAKKIGYLNISYKEFETRLKTSHTLAVYHFGSMEKYRYEIAQYALRKEVIEIIRDAVMFRDIDIKDVPKHLHAKLFTGL
jgi:hypothetical protein